MSTYFTQSEIEAIKATLESTKVVGRGNGKAKLIEAALKYTNDVTLRSAIEKVDLSKSGDAIRSAILDIFNRNAVNETLTANEMHSDATDDVLDEAITWDSTEEDDVEDETDTTPATTIEIAPSTTTATTVDDKPKATFNARVGNHTMKLYNYLKHDGEAKGNEKWRNSHGKVTGTAALNNNIDNLGCVDVDVPKMLDDDKKQEIRDCILEKLVGVEPIAETGNGGLHIYCNLNNFPIPKNRSTKAIKQVPVCDTALDIDLFGDVDPEKRSLILLPGSKIISAKDTVSEYKWIRGSGDSVVTHTMADILIMLGWVYKSKAEIAASKTATVKTKKTAAKSKANDDFEEIDDEQDDVAIAAMIEAIENFEIHNCTNQGDNAEDAENDEVTLLVIFKAINCIKNDELREQAYDKCFELCTDNAKSRFNSEKRLHKDERSSIGKLVNIIKTFNPTGYEEKLKNVICGFRKRPFKVNTTFSLSKFQELAARKTYHSLSHAASDLARIYRYHEEGEDYFIEKGKDMNGMYTFRYVKVDTIHRKLKEIELYKETITTKGGKEKEVTRTAWDAFVKYKRFFNFNAVRFNSPEDDVINYFYGYKYNELDTEDLAVINDFLLLVRVGISDNDWRVYNYILNWIAYMIQHPGSATRVAIILKGTQGAGKNTFTDIISTLLTRYAQANVTRLEELTGRFNTVLENCMFMVLNEMKTARDEYVQNIDALKSIITDPTYRIEEKFQPARVVDNVCNFIFISNHSKPIIIPPNDRRYLVVRVSETIKLYNNQLLVDLHHKDSNFYDNLLTFFLHRDISKFDPTDIPITEDKRDLIIASRTNFDEWIVRNYDELVKGVNATRLKQLFMTSILVNKMQWSNFSNQIKDKCVKRGRFGIKVDGKTIYVHKLTEENTRIYKPTDEERELFKNSYDDDIM
ncbi:hypothetical protein IKN40_01135 [bacterium]|nr:hypothetical protein [bacterium]